MASIQPHCATRELHVNSCRKRIQVSMKQMQLVCIFLLYINRTRIGVGFTWIYVLEIYVKPKKTNLIEGHPVQTDLKFNQNISLWEENWRLKIIARTLLYLDAFISLYIFNCILGNPIKYPRKYPKYHVRQWATECLKIGGRPLYCQFSQKCYFKKMLIPLDAVSWSDYECELALRLTGCINLCVGRLLALQMVLRPMQI